MDPNLQIVSRPVDALIPYARNARTHSPEQIGKIAASIREWGWTNPVLVDETGMIIAGHGRVLAAKHLRMTQVPAIVAARWSEEQKRAYVLADNRLALDAGWDENLLGLELAELGAFGFDLPLIGFTADEIAQLTKPAAGLLGDPDVVPPVPENPVSRLGDVWLLGEHRCAATALTQLPSQQPLQAPCPT